MKGYLRTQAKEECFGCEACAQACRYNAIIMEEDDEGFRYPVIDSEKCVKCGACNKTCPFEDLPEKFQDKHYVFGGYNEDLAVRDRSTSGGIFSAIADEWCDDNYVIFGAAAKGLEVYHSHILDKKEIDIFRKSKYSQSQVEDSYLEAKKFLQEGKKVLFSGTPCQIAALRKILGDYSKSEKLLTVEVVCEGFPSPLLLRKYKAYLEEKKEIKIEELDYRYKDGNRWDYEVMNITYSSLHNPMRGTIKCDRWFNPFWIFWADRLMSRPSCVPCPFRTPDREADITLGDLWGSQLYCPELYGQNKGCSLVVCNSKKGIDTFKKTLPHLYGHELKYEDALKYQRPMRVVVPANPRRDEFMNDLKTLNYKELCKKWNPHEPLKVLFKKYIFGKNSQVVWLWNLKKRIKSIFK